jgi:hypothetical protein
MAESSTSELNPERLPLTRSLSLAPSPPGRGFEDGSPAFIPFSIAEKDQSKNFPMLTSGTRS